MRSRTAGVCAIALVVTVLVAGIAGAQNLSKLPPDIALPQSGDSPGKVVFSHQNHLGVQAKPDCTVCHPKLAPIMKATKGAKRTALTHALMSVSYTHLPLPKNRAEHITVVRIRTQ